VRDEFFDPDCPRLDTFDADTALPGEDDENPVSGLWREDERGDEWWRVLARPGSVARAERLAGRATEAVAPGQPSAAPSAPAEPARKKAA
jgi:hypothetical protein